ncbi:MAG: diaminopimelate epimerase [Clostridiales bacterium]|nr:diaminopimelate epimerase [Clostridiales bacterium]
MKFTKMQGAGNDYIYVDCFKEKVPNPNETAVKVSDRHFGIGADGLVLIEPSDVADFKMDMYNSDGSQAKMCGNATRCVAKYVYDNGMTDKTEIALETLSGIKHIKMFIENGKVTSARVNMGAPVTDPKKIPVNLDGDIVLGHTIEVGGDEYAITCISMGNPHCVVFFEDTHAFAVDKIGPLFEHHPLFPDRVNTEFVQPIDAKTLKMRVWERGAGETLACGTGACATVAAAILNGHCKKDEDIRMLLLGGVLVIRWDSKSGDIYMTGPAETVCTGEIDL